MDRAIELMQAIIALSKNQFNTATLCVGKCADIAAIKLLGAILESILLPFIDITLSLHQQIAHLSRYAHLTFMFFRLHRSAFMPHVLYYNSQMMVKNACFCIAKHEKLDGSQLIQTGDYCLEKLFGITHMRGQYNLAMNYSQALDCIGAAKESIPSSRNIQTLSLVLDNSKSLVLKDLIIFVVICGLEMWSHRIVTFPQCGKMVVIRH